jgi:type I restriction enzyme, R subunit
VIFDFCGNFEFFDENPDGFESTGGQSVSAQIFEKRLLLASKLRNEPWKQDAELQEYREQILNMLHQQIANLEKQSIQVRPHLKLVHKLEDRGIWEHLESHERKEIVKKLGEVIPVELNEEERSRRFDLLMLVLQHERLDGVLNDKPTKETVIGFAEHLWQKRHIPAIKKVLPTLQTVMDEAFWKEPGVLDLDEVRVKMRELIQLIDYEKQEPVYTNFKDQFGEAIVHPSKAADSAIDPGRYRRKMEKFIEEHQNHLIIEKIRKAQPLTDKEVETLENFLIDADPSVNPDDFHEIVGGGMDLIRFIRSASGLSREAVMKQFEEFLQDKRLSSNQIQFINQMIEFYTQKGHLDIAALYEPPFDFLDQDGIEGVFRNQNNVADLLIERVRGLNEVQVG